MSRQTPACAFAGTADTVKAIKEMATRMAQNLAFRIGNQLYNDEASLVGTSNNIK